MTMIIVMILMLLTMIVLMMIRGNSWQQPKETLPLTNATDTLHGQISQTTPNHTPSLAGVRSPLARERISSEPIDLVLELVV